MEKSTPPPSTCPQCAAPVQEQAFCPECGAPLAPAPVGKGPRPSHERSRAAYELNRAQTVIGGARGLFWLFTIVAVYGLLAGLGILSFAAAEAEEATWLMIVSSALLCAISLGGALRVGKEPLVWGIALAAICSLNLAVILIASDWRVPFVESVFALFSWTAIAPLAKAQRLLRAHGDLRIAQQIRGEFRAEKVAESELGRRARERTRRERKQKWQRIGAVVGVLVLGIVALIWAVNRRPAARAQPIPFVAAKPPAAIDARLASFESAWNRGDLDAVAGFYAGDERAAYLASVESFLARQGWSTRLPALARIRLEQPYAGRARAVYALPDGEFSVDWRWQDPEWVLRSFRFKKTQ